MLCRSSYRKWWWSLPYFSFISLILYSQCLWGCNGSDKTLNAGHLIHLLHYVHKLLFTSVDISFPPVPGYCFTLLSRITLNWCISYQLEPRQKLCQIFLTENVFVVDGINWLWARDICLKMSLSQFLADLACQSQPIAITICHRSVCICVCVPLCSGQSF